MKQQLKIDSYILRLRNWGFLKSEDMKKARFLNVPLTETTSVRKESGHESQEAIQSIAKQQETTS